MEPQGTFGPLLRQERERRQISLESIAANTKIARSLLEALERDDVSRWPSGIFRKAFIRSYAEAIGLDADAITREFLERFPDPSEPRVSPAAAPAPSTAERPHDAVIVLKLTLPRSLVSWFRWPIRS
jgi:cytoskeletal protein RodZ